jgi:hypothetical protein
MNKKLFLWIVSLIGWVLFFTTLTVLAADNTCDFAENISADAGNTFKNATPIKLNSSQSHFIQSETDKDWFLFAEAKSGHSYLITAHEIGEGVDIRLELSEKGNNDLIPEEIDDGNRHFEGGTEQIELLEADNDTAYYVKVETTGFLLRDKETSYTLCVTDITQTIPIIEVIEPTDNITISADTVSSIGFKVVSAIDSDPIANRKVNFTIKEKPAESTNASLFPDADFTDTNGEVTVDFTPDKVGQYIIMATLAENSTIIASATVNVVAGTAVELRVVEGNDQQISVDEGTSSPIVFELLDEKKNKVTEEAIIFSLEQSNDGWAFLNQYSDNTDANGQVKTILTATEVGTYTVIATLAENPAISAKTNVVFKEQPPEQMRLVVISGNNQTTFIGTDGKSIIFKLVNGFDNAVEGQRVFFDLISPSENSAAYLSVEQSITDANGQVSTVLTTPDEIGDYTIIARLSENPKIRATATVFVSSLPFLGRGLIFGNEDNSRSTTATFSGGVSVDGQNFFNEGKLDNTGYLNIQGLIDTDVQHLGMYAEIIVVVGYEPLISFGSVTIFGSVTYFMLDAHNSIQAWDFDMASLVPYGPNIALSQKHKLDIYDGPIDSCRLSVFFGYRLKDGTVIYNGNTIFVIIN